MLTTMHATRALKGFAANLLAVEVPGPTFFELKQILRFAKDDNKKQATVNLYGTTANATTTARAWLAG